LFIASNSVADHGLGKKPLAELFSPFAKKVHCGLSFIKSYATVELLW
jgi:hypothetical protein